jgi:hypothetical protein
MDTVSLPHSCYVIESIEVPGKLRHNSWPRRSATRETLQSASRRPGLGQWYQEIQHARDQEIGKHWNERLAGGRPVGSSKNVPTFGLGTLNFVTPAMVKPALAAFLAR